MNRYFKASQYYKSDIIVRITGDCPLVDHELVDTMLKKFLKNKIDFMSNNDPPTFPDGFDIEIFKFKHLKRANFFAEKKYDKEHVTPFIKN